MIEVKAMNWASYKQFQEEIRNNESIEDNAKRNLINTELLIKYSTGLSQAELEALPFIEVQKLIAECNKVSGFDIQDAEKN